MRLCQCPPPVGGGSNVDRDGKTPLEIKAIGVAIAAFAFAPRPVALCQGPQGQSPRAPPTAPCTQARQRRHATDPPPAWRCSAGRAVVVSYAGRRGEAT